MTPVLWPRVGLSVDDYGFRYGRASPVSQRHRDGKSVNDDNMFVIPDLPGIPTHQFISKIRVDTVRIEQVDAVGEPIPFIHQLCEFNLALIVKP